LSSDTLPGVIGIDVHSLSEDHPATRNTSRLLMHSRSFGRDERGATFVEFAIVSAIFILLVFGLIEFGIAYLARNTVTAAAREGARYAMVRGSDSGRLADTGSVAAFVRSRTSLSPIRVSTVWADATKKPGTIVNVNVQYTHRPMSPLAGLVLPDSVVLGSTSRMVIVF